DWDEKSDLTRLEDLSEFLHQDDPEVEAKLKEASDEEADDVSSEDDTLPGIPTPDLSQVEDESEEEEEALSSMSLDDLEDSPDNNPPLPIDQFDDQSENQLLENQLEDEEDLEGSLEVNSEENLQDLAEEEDSSWDSPENSEESTFGEEEESTFGSDDDSTFGEEEEPTFGSDDDSPFGDEEESTFSSDDESPFGDDQEETEQENNDQEENDGPNLEEEEIDSPPSESSFQLPDPEELEQDESPYISAAPRSDESTHFSERENFQDLRDFGNAITYGVVKTGGNPPFSLILRNIKTLEDAEDIKIIMNEHGLVNPENEETVDQGLEQGSLLISQISEYSAIYLAHKMRRFDVELRIGLSDQLHPSKSYSREGRGLVSKNNLSQNKMETLETENHSIEIEDIKLSTTPTLDGYVIRHYLQVMTSHSLVEEAELRRLHSISNSSEDFSSQDEIELDNILEQFPSDEIDEEMEPFDLGLNEVYRELVEDLRNQAFKLEANAVVGINFNITPMAFQRDSSKVHYKITCSGNAVWVVDHQ
ncbi:MAG: hypothetical protein NXH75_14375, partial [Halobacteriovoraceae bacterium]|nr:hypothetical protein [Halobacteriovoraceae bacterium]